MIAVASREVSASGGVGTGRLGVREKCFFASRDAIRVNPIFFASRDATPRGTLVPVRRVASNHSEIILQTVMLIL